MEAGWMELHWTAWMPLMAAHPLALAQLPSDPGFYRVRAAGEVRHLVWIGWAERGVRETVERLSRQVHMPVPPFDDPGAPALALWRLRRSGVAAFEVSGAVTPDGSMILPSLQRAYDEGIEAQVVLDRGHDPPLS